MNSNKWLVTYIIRYCVDGTIRPQVPIVDGPLVGTLGHYRVIRILKENYAVSRDIWSARLQRIVEVFKAPFYVHCIGNLVAHHWECLTSY